MKKIKKLTPSRLKRIIAEERQKLVNENNLKEVPEDQSILKELALLLKIKSAQKKRVLELKKLHEARKTLKKSITGRI